MEEELDLRPYLLALIRRWPLIFGLATIVAATITVLALLSPRPSLATANILIVPATSQVALDPRFVTRDATLLTNVTYQRQALLGLASSSSLEQRVIAQVGLDAVEPGALLSKINVTTDGDLLQIEAGAQTDTEALALVEAWGRSYEQLVAETYSRDVAGLALIDTQLAEAQKRYGESQSNLEQFLSQSNSVQVEQKIASIQAMLDGSSKAGTDLYTRYLTHIQDVELLLSDARALRAQVAEGQADGLANRLAVLTLRSRLVGGTSPLGVQVTDPTNLSLDADAALAELDGLIVTLEQQRDSLQNEATRLAEQVAMGSVISGGLDPAARQSYERELTTLRSQIAQIEGQQKALEQSRDIALSSLELLQRKRDEQQIAETTPLISVRYISASVEPSGSGLLSALIWGALGAVVGGLLGVLLALWLEIGRPRLARLRDPAAVPDRQADEPVAAP